MTRSIGIAAARVRDIAELLGGRVKGPNVDDWSRPLIGAAPGNGPGADLLARPLKSGGLPREALAGSKAPSQNGPRCLLATSRLDVGGLDEVVAFLARHLSRYGVRTGVLLAPASGERRGAGRLAQMLRAKGVEVHEAGPETGPDWIRQWAPDVISAHGAPYWVYEAAESMGLPFVDNLHGMYSIFEADWRWHRDACAGGTLAAVIVVSDLIRQDYLARNPAFPAERLVLIPNGVDAERRSGGDRETARQRLGLTDEFMFVSLARHSLQKNTYGLLAAFGQLARRRPEAHLVVAGRPDDLRYFRRVLRLRDSLPGHDRIHLRDHTTAPAELLAAADGFVLDSFFEGWSLASMEALFAGLPVVLSDVGGAREQVGNNSSRGYVVSNPLGDPLSVSWEAVGAARFRPQVNRDEFAARMEDLVVDRDHYLGARDQLASESARRFGADVCLRAHAATLSAAARGTSVSVGTT